MKKISLIALLLTVSFIPNANAASKSQGDAYAAAWGVTEQTYCKGSGADVGWKDYDGKTTKQFAWAMMDNKSDGDLGHGAVYYVAREMTDNGYKFCRTVIAADRDGGCTKQPYTTYYFANKIGEDCFWLCADGYWGDECTGTTFTKDDNVNLATHAARQKYVPENYHALYNILPYTDSGNKEEEIPMLKYNQKHDCSKNQSIDLNSNKDQEHDTVLAIRKIEVDSTNNSVTYTIQPLAVRAGAYTGCYRKGDDAAWPMVFWTGTTKNTFCPSSGFLHKADGTGGCYFSDGESAAQSQEEQSAYKAAQSKAQSLEEQGLAILCQGFDRAKYDNKVHVLNSNSFMYQNWRTVGGTSNNLTKEEYIKSKCPGMMDSTCVSNVGNTYDSIYGNAGATCTVFVCKGEGMGYKSDPMGDGAGDFTCVSCMQSDDATIHPSRLGVGRDGICKVCAVGEVYSSTTKTCETAKSIHKYYMGGLLKKNETEPRNLKEQCWTKPTPDLYKACIAGTGYADDLLPTQNSGGGEKNNGIIPTISLNPGGWANGKHSVPEQISGGIVSEKYSGGVVSEKYSVPEQISGEIVSEKHLGGVVLK